jgi:hypothetical protein
LAPDFRFLPLCGGLYVNVKLPKPRISIQSAVWSRSGSQTIDYCCLFKRYRVPAAHFARKYTAGDIAPLVEMDKANEVVCGLAVAHLLQRAYSVYGDASYERLWARMNYRHCFKK